MDSKKVHIKFVWSSQEYMAVQNPKTQKIVKCVWPGELWLISCRTAYIIDPYREPASPVKPVTQGFTL